VGGPNTRITNPRWRTAAILKKSKNRHISVTVLPIATKFGMGTHIDPLNLLTVEILNFKKSIKNRHISATA